MVQFHLGENSISFSDDFNKLNTLRTDIIDDMSQFSIYDSMEQLISKHGKILKSFSNPPIIHSSLARIERD